MTHIPIPTDIYSWQPPADMERPLSPFQEQLTGFIDFTGACFEDPHIGMAKYWTCSWYPLNKAGIVERYLEEQQLSFAEFAPRLAVRCLWTLQRELAVTVGEDILVDDEFESHADYRRRILDLLAKAMREFRFTT